MLDTEPFQQLMCELTAAILSGRHTLVDGDSRQTIPAFAAAKPAKFDVVFVDGGYQDGHPVGSPAPPAVRAWALGVYAAR